MIRGNRILAGFALATLVVGALSGAAAIADEGVEQIEAPAEDAVLELVEDEGAEVETSAPAEEPVEADPNPIGDDGDAESTDSRDARPRPAPRGNSHGRSSTAAASSAQPGPDGQGSVEIDPESAEGACPGGTALKIDNLRSNGTFGPITISNYTNTSFTWTSTEAVSAVLVKDGGGHKTNPGGTSGSASTFGQDISHVIFCLGGDVPAVEAEEPCEADEAMPEDDSCVPPPCADETMPDAEPCVPAPCADDTMPEDESCVPAPCEAADETTSEDESCVPAPCADESMPDAESCVPPPCDTDEKKPGRQGCTEGGEDVAGVKSDPEKPADEDDDQVQGAGLAADREPDGAAQPRAAQPVVQGSILPFTGGQVVPLLMVALGLVYAGGGAILIRRP